jgi:hypothetical protein
MVLRTAYAPVLPEMDLFLFADVGKEVDGIPLSVLSALARLGVDPRDEAARLSRLTSKAAASQLSRLFARLPDRPWTPPEIRRIAKRLVELLPAPPKGGEVHQVTSAVNRKLSFKALRHLFYLALALSGGLVFGLIAQGHVTPGGHVAAQPASQAAPPSAPMAR